MATLEKQFAQSLILQQKLLEAISPELDANPEERPKMWQLNALHIPVVQIAVKLTKSTIVPF